MSSIMHDSIITCSAIFIVSVCSIGCGAKVDSQVVPQAQVLVVDSVESVPVADTQELAADPDLAEPTVEQEVKEDDQGDFASVNELSGVQTKDERDSK